MSEYLDIYDENQNYLGKEPRSYVHENALWHKTVHCWLYDKDGNIYFQIRHDSGTFYTTASGHVLAGETVKQAFGREIQEEIGIHLDYEKAELVNVVPFKMDKIKKDGSVFRDRAFANVFIYRLEEDNHFFIFDPNEVDGLATMKAKDVLNLLEKEKGSIPATIIMNQNDEIITKEKVVGVSNFLVNDGETGIGKYGDVLRRVIEKNEKWIELYFKIKKFLKRGTSSYAFISKW